MGFEELKARNDRFWKSFSEFGVFPEIPSVGATYNAVSFARDAVNTQYFPLLGFIYGEALVRCSAATEEEMLFQVGLVSTIIAMIKSKVKNYSKKDEMEKNFINVCLNSRNEHVKAYVKRELGLEKAKNTLNDLKSKTSSSDSNDAIIYAIKCLNRLIEIRKSSVSQVISYNFIQLGIDIGFFFNKKDINIKGEDINKLIDLLNGLYSENKIANQKQQENCIRLINDLNQKVMNNALSFWDWHKELSALCKTDERAIRPDSCIKLLNQLESLVMLPQWYRAYYKDTLIRELGLRAVCRLIKKYARDTIDYKVAHSLLSVLYNDGLRDLPATCYARSEKQDLQNNQEGNTSFWPSLAEDLYTIIYQSADALYAKNNSNSKILEWAANYLSHIKNKFNDLDWIDFHIGKLCLWADNLKDAKRFLLPTIREKQTEFWAWTLLGSIFPDKEKECIARALLCKADEKYTKKLKEKAVGMFGLPLDDSNRLREYAIVAEELLLEGIEPIRSVLVEKFKNSEGKERLRFSDGTGTPLSPISPAKVALTKGAPLGVPVSIYTNPKEKSKIIAVKPRTGQEWDVLPRYKASFVKIRADKNGKKITDFVIKGISCTYFSEVKNITSGTPCLAYFLDYVKQGKENPQCVHIEVDHSVERSAWDTMVHEQAVFKESYRDKEGNLVHVFITKSHEYKYYEKIDIIEPGTPVDITLMASPDSARVYQASYYQTTRKPGTFIIKPSSNNRCYDVAKSTDTARNAWDILNSAIVMFCGKNKNGNSFLFTSGNHQYNALVSKFPFLETMPLGSVFKIHYYVRIKKDDERIRDVMELKLENEIKLNLTTSFSGVIRFIENTTFGYVDLYNEDEEKNFDDDFYSPHPYGSVFVSSDLVKKHDIQSGMHVEGIAAIFPSKFNKSKRGNTYENKRYHAISITNINEMEMES